MAQMSLIGSFLTALGDGFDDRFADHAVGNFVDDDQGFASLGLLGVNLGAEGEAAAAGFVSFDDSVFPADDSAGGEIGAGDDLQQFG